MHTDTQRRYLTTFENMDQLRDKPNKIQKRRNIQCRHANKISIIHDPSPTKERAISLLHLLLKKAHL